ncbi:MAG: GEVED domain-containing protein [Bacteroidota bacterium]
MKKILLLFSLFSGITAWGQYCAPSYNSACSSNDFINDVSFGTISNTGTGCTGAAPSNYVDYTATLSTNVQQNLSYTLTVAPGPSWGQYFVAWIDYDLSGTFDASEFIDIGYASAGTTINTSVTIPATATAGQSRIRVMCRYGTGTLSAGDACASGLSFGETEDYGVFIGTPLADDAGVTAFVNPLIPTCSFNDSVSVTLKNYGTDTLTSASINWSWNSIVQTPAFWTGSIAPQSETTVFVGTVAYGAGDDLAAWSSNPNGVIENPTGSYNDSTVITGLLTGLSGVYTIGGTTPDFPDILSAIAALNFAGVCGPTTFNLRSGTYYDQFDLVNVIGMNATNTVTIRSEAGHRDSVIIDFGAAGSSNNYVILMDNADYFHIEQMTLRNSSVTYGRVFDIQGGSDYNVIYDCNIITQINNTTSTNSVVIWSNGSVDEYNTFDGNSIIGGSYGAYWYGTGTTSLERENVFSNNEFQDNYYTGLRLYYQEAPTATHNRFFGNSTYTSRYGLYAGYCDKGAILTYNSIESNATSYWYYGLYAYYCDGTASSNGMIANNSITTGNAGSTGTTYGMQVYYSGYFNIYNNSVSVPSGSTSSRAFYLYEGGANTVKNNTFTNFGDGYASYVYGSFSVTEMDYNNYYSNGTNLGYFGSANTASFAAWQTASGFDVNSLNVDPGFYSDYDLHVCSDSLNNAGSPLALVTDDRDGQMRDAGTPDIGSDEFAPLGLPGFLGADALVCTGETVNLWAGTAADDVLWSTGDTTYMLGVSTPGTYTVSVIGACGINFDTIVISASALAYTGYLMADTMAFCTGGSALLTSSMMADTYSWTGGSSNDSLVVTTGGTYTLNITDACGTGTESVVITESSVPVAGFTSFVSFVSGDFTNTTTGGGNPTYAWNFGDGNTSTDTDPIHIYNAVGTFYVTLTVTNDCGTSTFGDSITVTTLGLEEIAGLGTIAVYPNPSNGLFQIDFNTNNDMNITVQVTNVLGESVYVKDLGSINGTHKDAIDIANAAPGVYYVTIVSNNETVLTSKLIKQ